MSIPIPTLRLDVPDGWELTLELRLVEPEKAMIKAPLAMKESPKPRANLNIIRRAAEPTTAAVMLNAFLRSIASEIPGLKKHDEGPFKFADGSVGAMATISYEVAPGMSVAQRHVYRIDDGVLTHFIASTPELDLAKLDKVLTPVLATFKA